MKVYLLQQWMTCRLGEVSITHMVTFHTFNMPLVSYWNMSHYLLMAYSTIHLLLGNTRDVQMHLAKCRAKQIVVLMFLQMQSLEL